ncbi:DUF5316 family protein [Paenibacillus glucanolyticus]|uniref:DUF5316 family protein n=1 Tax=Paenibacillus glucanolyticus TaxID=59843 RepID=UPI00096D33AD|nr:DUF5316 family protein [Paenibacillus glucanolyticus]OMF76072.1 hypothetical protein BK142_16385 [Paenibacillus glucanolyticus]
MNLLIIAGIVCLLVTGLLSGAFTTGDQQRGNFYAESKVDRTSKRKAANWFFLAGVLLLAVGGAVHLLLR